MEKRRTLLAPPTHPQSVPSPHLRPHLVQRASSAQRPTPEAGAGRSQATRGCGSRWQGWGRRGEGQMVRGVVVQAERGQASLGTCTRVTRSPAPHVRYDADSRRTVSTCVVGGTALVCVMGAGTCRPMSRCTPRPPFLFHCALLPPPFPHTLTCAQHGARSASPATTALQRSSARACDRARRRGSCPPVLPTAFPLPSPPETRDRGQKRVDDAFQVSGNHQKDRLACNRSVTIPAGTRTTGLQISVSRS